MRPNLLATLVLGLSSSASLPAFAQEANCSASDWFCSTNEPTTVESEAVEAAPAPVEVHPEVTESKAPSVEIIIVQPGATVAQPPPSRHAPAARVCGRQAPRKQAAASSKKTPDAWKSTAGFEFRLQRFGFMFDRGPNMPEASMIGGGAGLRIPVRRNLEVNAQNDMLYGKDFNGFNRSELGLSLHLVRHFNPDNWLRFYSIGGLFVALGHVTSDRQSQLTPREYDGGKYFATFGALSGQAGFGAEMRMSPHFSFRTDVQLAMRWRFAATQDAPEYWDSLSNTGRNTYPGFLMRAGVTIW